jgi:UDPglucose 6-dehydrogenase
MASNLEYFDSCASDIKKYSKGFKIIVEKSTVPVKTAERLSKILSENQNNFDFEILSNPEFLAEGTAVNDMLNPDRVLIGGNSSQRGKKSIEALSKLYEKWIPKSRILKTNVWSSELAKLASNAMLAQRISSINSLSALCEKTGADINELSKAIGMDNRIGSKFLKPSPGFGGSCFQKDLLNLIYISTFFGLEEVAEYWNQVLKINDYQRRRIAQIVINSFDESIMGKSILILGWAFKANTDDTRESSSISITEKLYTKGAKISIYDPKVKKNSILEDISEHWNSFNDGDLKILNSLERNISFDAVIVLTEWEEFKNLNFSNECKIFDCRDILNHKKTFYRLGVKS